MRLPRHQIFHRAGSLGVLATSAWAQALRGLGEFFVGLLALVTESDEPLITESGDQLIAEQVDSGD